MKNTVDHGLYLVPQSKPLVVNLFAEPGAGKSTLAAGIFYELKMRGLNVELVREYAKDKVWEGSFAILDDQVYVFGKQLHRMNIVAKQVSVTITDSPVALSLYYDRTGNEEFKALIMKCHGTFDNMNYFIHRKKAYNPIGRMQTEDEAKEVSVEILRLLNDNNIAFTAVNGDREGLQSIVNDILGRLEELR